MEIKWIRYITLPSHVSNGGDCDIARFPRFLFCQARITFHNQYEGYATNGPPKIASHQQAVLNFTWRIQKKKTFINGVQEMRFEIADHDVPVSASRMQAGKVAGSLSDLVWPTHPDFLWQNRTTACLYVFSLFWRRQPRKCRSLAPLRQWNSH